MRKEKKASRVEHEAVCITEWAGPERRWLFIKRPEKGLLAGLFEPPTIPINPAADKLAAALEGLDGLLGTPTRELGTLSHTEVAAVPHIFSHIDMTYHVQHLVLECEAQPPTPERGVWLTADEVERANVGTGVKKVWAAAYGAWGKTERTGKAATKAKPKPKAKAAPKRKAPEFKSENGKFVRKVMMPIMPQK
jgi:A/G-specific adenine glycosylase